MVAREGARVITGEDERPYGEALFSGHHRPEGEEQLDVTSIHLTTDALTRRAAGRRSTDEIHYTVTGDEEIARRVLDALVVTPERPQCSGAARSEGSLTRPLSYTISSPNGNPSRLAIKAERPSVKVVGQASAVSGDHPEDP